MLDLAPGNEHIVEIGHRIEFVADRGERPVIRIGVGLSIGLARDDGHAGSGDRNERVDRLIGRLPRAPQIADQNMVREGDGGTDCLPSAYNDTVFAFRSEEHTSELQSLMRISYAVFCLKKKTKQNINI